MPYYGGDYYRGDYYRGDPFLGKIGKVIGGVAKALVPAPIRAAVEVGRKLLGPGPAQGVPPRQNIPFWPDPVRRDLYFPPPAPGQPIVGLAPGMAQAYSCGPDGRPRGRWNKSTYITRGGGTSRWPREILIHYKGTECVKPRRMNVANSRALRRALRRAQGFAKLARRYVRISTSFKRGKRGKRK